MGTTEVGQSTGDSLWTHPSEQKITEQAPSGWFGKPQRAACAYFSVS